MSLESWFPVWTATSRPLIGAITLGLLWTAEGVAPMFSGRQRRLPHAAANLGLALCNALIATGLALALVAATDWAGQRGFGLLTLTPLPLWVHCLLAILALDCWQYWWHRGNHTVPLLWRFHAIHHADAEMDASTGVRFHTVEMLFSFLARLLLLPLLGISLPELLFYETISLPVILFQHSNLRMSNAADRSLRWLIVTPWMHLVHHSRLQAETDANYTSLLSIWDRLFGSFKLRERPADIHLGLDGYSRQDWGELPGMLAAPFSKRSATENKAG